MDLAGVVDTVVRTIQSVSNLISEDTKIKSELKNGLEYLRCEMEMIEAEIDKYEDVQLQELSYEIEDFLYGLWTPGVYGFILSVFGMEPRAQELNRISYFKERIQSLRKWQQGARSSGQLSEVDDGSTATSSSYSVGSNPEPDFPASQRVLVGVAEPKRELLELLSLSAHGEESGKLRVITVVGCRGIGKTALVRAVYEERQVVESFPWRVWVKASRCNCSPASVEDILNSILHQVRPGQEGEIVSSTNTSTKQLQRNVQEALRDKRYLVVVDDVLQSEVWDGIKHVFPENNTPGSRIIVTTSIQTVAKSCCSGSYRYSIQGLGDADSKELFWTEVFGCKRAPAPVLVDSSEGIFRKCDGLPSALVGIAKHLGRKVPDLTGDDCVAVYHTLGNYLAGKVTDSAFGEIRRALAQCYDSLPDYRHKNCLLSVAMFPKGHLVNRKSLVRRLVAEGLVVGDVVRSEADDANDHLQKLIDRSIIEPAVISNNSVVKRFKVHGIILEFIVHKAISQNFATLIHKDRRLPIQGSSHTVHRLCVHDGTADSARLAEEVGLSRIRSLNICNSSPVDLKACKLLRVLDLEHCKGIQENVLDDICRLPFLRYLSLRRTDVDSIPKKISELVSLQTLDIRETRIGVLSVEIIMLPQLAHLFGRFELPRDLSDATRYPVPKFFSEKSRLQTLAGVVISSKADQVLDQILRYATKLRKIKVWYETTSASSVKKAKYNDYFDVPLIFTALENRLNGSRALESVCIDSGDFASHFLRYLKSPCAVTSLKLRGRLESLPEKSRLCALRNLTRLQLSSSGLTSETLSALQFLPCLVYLLLDEDVGFLGDIFLVEPGGFPSLQRLCFRAARLPHLCIQQGAMDCLTSLHLLCTEVGEGLVDGIAHLQRINEVMLHYSVSDVKLQAWKAAATQHKNRPSVKRQQQPTSISSTS